jgi:hypothetical protein
VGSLLPGENNVSNKPTKVIPRTHQTQLAKGTDVTLAVARGAPIKRYVACRIECDRINIASTELALKLDIILPEC